MSPEPLHDAATIVLWRQSQGGAAEVLMGRRGRSAVFMPDKYVFPGGRVDPADALTGFAAALDDDCRRRLEIDAAAPVADALAFAAIRELFEETGLALGQPGIWSQPAPKGWTEFAALGLEPNAAPLLFFFRAITPPGRPRRFDARFFICEAGFVVGDTEKFSDAGPELSDLRWVTLDQARSLSLPFVTSVVLAELQGHLANPGPLAGVPFFDNRGETPRFLSI